VIFHIAAVIAIGALSAWGVWQSAQADIGPVFLLYLLPALLAAGALPFLLYRLYALRTGSYSIERDGLRLRWGLRYEDIPMNKVVWVHPAGDLSAPLPLPLLRWPGAVLGRRRLPGAESTGAGSEVEFLAASTRRILLVATPQRIYAISPQDGHAFLQTYRRFTEMGSLFPLPARSMHPTYLLTEVWSARPARVLLLAGLAASILLLVWVSLAIPARDQVHMGFKPDGAPGDLVPAVRLLLLSVIAIFFYLVDLLLGLFFFRRQESHAFSYLLWGSGVLTPLLAILAVLLILRSG
jgi:hypothetical protein